MNDLKFIRDLKRGEPEAYKKLYDEHVSKIGRIAKSYLGVDDVEDVIQEVFIKVYKNIKKFRGDSALSTWIYRITVNVCKDMLAKKHRKKEILTSFGLEEDDEKTFPEPVEETRPSDEFLKEVSSEEIRRAIDSLSQEDRLLITLREIEGMSYAEIADVVEKPIGTVKSKLHYARERLKDILEEKEK
ncbi:RNA polymerase sigma factor [Mesoaciditoga lauensis]|uniref:RNA polymerase sigma factor n=1 Tax=Mesoaciditoga lauensis TaxID=1495039 RepID=UPI0005617130|nr:sigma-70 family RNA polymerase sigma factor [Mesoaciditoga lauensis]